MIKKKVQRRIQNPAKHLRWRFLQVCRRCFVKNVFLKVSQNLYKGNCANLVFNKVASLSLQLHQKGPLAQVFFCEFCEICKNPFFYRKPLDDSFCSLFDRFVFFCIGDSIWIESKNLIVLQNKFILSNSFDIRVGFFLN